MNQNEFQDLLKTLYTKSEIQFLYHYIQRELASPNWNEIIERLLNTEPIDYILGHTYFYGLKLFVNQSTLIPRPETEELVEWILNEYKHHPPKKVLDIGTGSGCIALALANHWKNNSSITAVDISPLALEMAAKNAKNLHLDINFQQLDILDNNSWEKLENYDLIVSNPPYIPLAEKKEIDKSVLDFEPHSALFVSNTQKLVFYEKILEMGYIKLNKNGRIFFETHQDFFIEQYPNYKFEWKKDLSQNQRMILAEWRDKLNSF